MGCRYCRRINATFAPIGGGPHAVYLPAVTPSRGHPRRLIGVSVDHSGRPAYRLGYKLESSISDGRRRHQTSVLLRFYPRSLLQCGGLSWLSRTEGDCKKNSREDSPACIRSEKIRMKSPSTRFDTLCLRTNEATDSFIKRADIFHKFERLIPGTSESALMKPPLPRT